jgi:hypothetical protein
MNIELSALIMLINLLLIDIPDSFPCFGQKEKAPSVFPPRGRLLIDTRGSFWYIECSQESCRWLGGSASFNS